MKGANDYSRVFKDAEQIGRLYLLPGSHARGPTFCIYIIPADEVAIAQYKRNPPTNDGVVEVYGMVSGQRGWTEAYNWIHKGPWVEEFEALYAERKDCIEQKNKATEEENKVRQKEEKSRVASLLSGY